MRKYQSFIPFILLCFFFLFLFTSFLFIVFFYCFHIYLFILFLLRDGMKSRGTRGGITCYLSFPSCSPLLCEMKECWSAVSLSCFLSLSFLLRDGIRRGTREDISIFINFLLSSSLWWNEWRGTKGYFFYFVSFSWWIERKNKRRHY